MIVERSILDYIQSEDETMVWTSKGKEFSNRLTRTRKHGATRKYIEDFLETDPRFIGEYVITPRYIFFEFEEEAILFKLIFTGY